MRFQVLDIVFNPPHPVTGAVVARTPRILLSTGVTVLSLRDPVRVAEDYATIDHTHLLDVEQQHDVLRRFAEEVVPLVRAEVKTDLWTEADSGRATGFTAL